MEFDIVGKIRDVLDKGHELADADKARKDRLLAWEARLEDCLQRTESDVPEERIVGTKELAPLFNEVTHEVDLWERQLRESQSTR